MPPAALLAERRRGKKVVAAHKTCSRLLQEIDMIRWQRAQKALLSVLVSIAAHYGTDRYAIGVQRFQCPEFTPAVEDSFVFEETKHDFLVIPA